MHEKSPTCVAHMQLLQRMQLLHTGIARRAAPHSATSRRALLAGLATALGSSQASASDAIVTARAVSAQRIAAERLSLEEAYVLYARAAELEEELEAQLLTVKRQKVAAIDLRLLHAGLRREVLLEVVVDKARRFVGTVENVPFLGLVSIKYQR